MNKIFDNANVPAMETGIALYPHVPGPVAKYEPEQLELTKEFLDFSKKALKIMVDSAVPVAASNEFQDAPEKGNGGDWFAWWDRDAFPRVALCPTYYVLSKPKQKFISDDKALTPTLGGISGYYKKIRAVWYEFVSLEKPLQIVKIGKDLSGRSAAEFQRGVNLLRGTNIDEMRERQHSN